MSDKFTISASPGQSGSPGHVGVDYSTSVGVILATIKSQADTAGVPSSKPFEPEVAFFIDLIASLRARLPEAMDKANWPKVQKSGDKLDEFILLTIKDLARPARGRGTNASAKQAVMRLEQS